MQLRRLGDAIRHTRPSGHDADYAACDEKYAAFGIGIEGRRGSAEEQRLRFDVDCEAGVPV